MQVLVQHYITAPSKRFNTTRQAIVESFRKADLSLSIDEPYNHELSIKGIAREEFVVGDRRLHQGTEVQPRMREIEG